MGVRVVDVHQSVFAVNDAIAEETRKELKRQKTFLINLMSSPGSGKTTLLLATAKALKSQYKIGIMEADIDATVDAEKLLSVGVSSIQIHTGGQCAMDAEMTRQAICSFNAEEFDLLVLENVGNLVCPAETDTGASKNVVILSIPEGDDKPLKYPLMFQKCDVVLVNKIDTRTFFTFDDKVFVENVYHCNPNAEIYFLSAKTGEGMDQWVNWLEEEIQIWNGGNSY